MGLFLHFSLQNWIYLKNYNYTGVLVIEKKPYEE